MSAVLEEHKVLEENELNAMLCARRQELLVELVATRPAVSAVLDEAELVRSRPRYTYFQYGLLTDPSTVSTFANSPHNHKNLPSPFIESSLNSSNPLLNPLLAAPTSIMSSRGNLRRVQNRQYTTNRLTEVQTALSTLSQSGPRTLQILKTGHSLLTECLTLRSWEIVIDRVLYPPIHDDGALSSRAFHGDLEHILTVLGHLKEMVEEYPDVKGGEGETGEKGKKGSVYE